MFKHFLKSALRFLKQNKAFTAINLFGLSIALASSFIILLYVINELSYDHCHKKWARIFRVNTYYTEFTKTFANTPYILASTLKNEYPQIEEATSTAFIGGLSIKINNQNIRVHRCVAASSEIFDILTIPLIENSRRNDLLDQINSIVLSRTLAEKIFPGIDPVGKSIVALLDGNEKIFEVTGVFADLPSNSTFQPSCFVNRQLMLDQTDKTFEVNDSETSWNYDFWTTWVLVKKGVNATSIENNFRVLEQKYLTEKQKKKYSLQNLSDIYLRSENIDNSGVKGSLSNIRMFSLIAFLIIMVASTNYIILSTAISTGRTKEIGLRKTNGAGPKSIRNQLISESVIMSIIVLPIALLLMRLALPFASQLFQTKLNILNYNLLKYIIAYAVLAVLIGIASGIYTSYYLSRLKVLDILQNTIHFGRKKQAFRSFLIFIQLVIFCTFTSCALVIRAQYKYALSKDIGYYTKDVVFIHTGIFDGYNAFIDKIKSNQYVISVSGLMEELPLVSSMSSIFPHFKDKEKEVVVEGLAVDYNLLPTMGMTLIKGRDFSLDFGSDFESVIVNQKAVKQLGIDDPIGNKLGSRRIIGVVKDFNLHSIHSDINPLEIHLTNKIIQDVAIHYKHGSLIQLLPFLKKEWLDLALDRPFEYSTIEEVISELYNSEKNLTTIVTISAFFTLIISALGLLGLTLFVARTRTKEIGIRKIFGCSERSIVFSFLKKNLLFVVLAASVSIPSTLLIMTKWLSNFSSRTTLHWWIFAFAFIVSLIIVMLTVFIHAYRASTSNPVKALRYE
jgi:putative ABC transport system permease protein